MRLPSFVLAFLFFTAPAAAFQDDGALACRLVDKAFMEHLAGARAGPLQPEARNVCAGLCPSLNASSCSFSVLRSHPEVWTVLVEQPPFEPGNWSAVDRSDRGRIEDISWSGAIAHWDYTAATGRGILSIYPKDRRVILTVVLESGGRGSAAALGETSTVAKRALVLFGRQK